MRRPVQFLMAGAIILLLGISGILLQLYRTASGQRQPSHARVHSEKVRIERAYAALAEIRDSLGALVPDPPLMRLRIEPPAFLQERPERQRRESLDRIAAIDVMLQRARARILELEAEMRATELEMAGVEHANAELHASLAGRDQTIGRLSGRIGSLQAAVTGLQGDVRRRERVIRSDEQTIETKRRESATIYYAVGTRQELARDGVIVAAGGVLGLGRTLQVSSQLDESRLIALDTDRQSTLSIRAPGARVLSAQPANSYLLSSSGNNVRLRILKPREFRKVKHLVIVVASA